MKLKVKIVDDRITPDMIGYKSAGAGAIDLYALPNADERDNLVFGETPQRFETGICVEIPQGYGGVIIPRSGVGTKGIYLANTTGLVDADFRGVVTLNLCCRGSSSGLKIDSPTRIAQMMIVPLPQFEVEFVDELSETERGSGGFGSTGTK